MVSVRVAGEPLVDSLVDRLIRELPHQPRKAFVLTAFAHALARFPDADTEDREAMAGYLETIMDIVGIESSDGLLMRWMYGEDLAALLARPKH